MKGKGIGKETYFNRKGKTEEHKGKGMERNPKMMKGTCGGKGKEQEKESKGKEKERNRNGKGYKGKERGKEGKG